MSTIVRRIRSWLVRRRKRNGLVWLSRLRSAFDRFWVMFYRMPRNKDTIRWAERNHRRLMAVKPPWRH